MTKWSGVAIEESMTGTRTGVCFCLSPQGQTYCIHLSSIAQYLYTKSRYNRSVHYGTPKKGPFTIVVQHVKNQRMHYFWDYPEELTLQYSIIVIYYSIWESFRRRVVFVVAVSTNGSLEIGSIGLPYVLNVKVHTGTESKRSER